MFNSWGETADNLYEANKMKLANNELSANADDSLLAASHPLPKSG
jgi:hypothetical protein